MYKLDNEFLKEVGLDSLPEAQKRAFLEHVYNELESRVGVKLTEGMSEEKLDEFAFFVDRNEEKIREWFKNNLADYASQPDFEKIKNNSPNLDEISLLSEYGAMKWLQKNRPDYSKIVMMILGELKAEIKANKDQILP